MQKIIIKILMKVIVERLSTKNVTIKLTNKKLVLFILESLFKKNNLSNIYSNFLSDKIKEIGLENLPKNIKKQHLVE